MAKHDLLYALCVRPFRSIHHRPNFLEVTATNLSRRQHHERSSIISPDVFVLMDAAPGNEHDIPRANVVNAPVNGGPQRAFKAEHRFVDSLVVMRRRDPRLGWDAHLEHDEFSRAICFIDVKFQFEPPDVDNIAGERFHPSTLSCKAVLHRRT